MRGIGRTRGVGLERGVLVAALLCGVILALAARGAPADPDRAGALALGEIATRLSAGLRATWLRVLAAVEPPVPAAGHVFTWHEVPDAEPIAIEPEPGGVNAVSFDIELLRAAQAELGEEDLDGARGWVRTALGRSGIELARRGRAWLRGIQLALRAGDTDEARSYAATAREELGGLEASDGTSLRLLITLAIAPALEPEEHAAAMAELALAWRKDELALPGSGARLRRDGAVVTLHEEPAVVALRGAVAELQGEEAAALPAVTEGRAVRALRRSLGGLPAPADGAPWRVEATPLGSLCSARRGERFEAFFVDASACAAALGARAKADGVLPADFAVEPSRPRDESSVVAARLALSGGALAVDLLHPDPAALVATERARASRTRLALLAAAAVLVAAGAMTSRAIRRERLLQELRTAFVAGVSHELRTPLASILLMAENLEEGRVQGLDVERRYHGLIRGEALRLRRLIENVLDFSLLERGVKPRLAREGVALGEWLDELERGWQRTAARLEGRVSVERSALPATAEVDGDALRRALDNLVENALQHGGGAVEVSVSVRGGALVFEVRDRGPGIPPARAERVFEAFVRLGDGDPEQPPGAGLGLAIVREIADAHRGTVHVAHPEDGPGALLVLTVPLREVDE